MECEFFCKPGTDLEWFAYWKDFCQQLAAEPGHQGGEPAPARPRARGAGLLLPAPLPTSSTLFPFTDWGELWGIADRTNYDLGRHQEASGKSLEYFDPETNEHYIPYVIEPSLGADRVALAFLCDAYDEEQLVDARARTTRASCCACIPALAPFKAAVLPLSEEAGRQGHARSTTSWPRTSWWTYDDAGSIGKRYRRQDEIGTPLCITVDFEHRGRRQDPRRQLRHRPRPRHHGAGPYAHLRAEGLHRQESGVLIRKREQLINDRKGTPSAAGRCPFLFALHGIAECCPHSAICSRRRSAEGIKMRRPCSWIRPSRRNSVMIRLTLLRVEMPQKPAISS